MRPEEIGVARERDFLLQRRSMVGVLPRDNIGMDRAFMLGTVFIHTVLQGQTFHPEKPQNPGMIEVQTFRKKPPDIQTEILSIWMPDESSSDFTTADRKERGRPSRCDALFRSKKARQYVAAIVRALRRCEGHLPCGGAGLRSLSPC